MCVGQQCQDVFVVTSSDEYHDRISIEPTDTRAQRKLREVVLWQTGKKQCHRLWCGYSTSKWTACLWCFLTGKIYFIAVSEDKCKIHTVRTLEHVPASNNRHKRPELLLLWYGIYYATLHVVCWLSHFLHQKSVHINYSCY